MSQKRIIFRGRSFPVKKITDKEVVFESYGILRSLAKEDVVWDKPVEDKLEENPLPQEVIEQPKEDILPEAAPEGKDIIVKEEDEFDKAASARVPGDPTAPNGIYVSHGTLGYGVIPLYGNQQYRMGSDLQYVNFIRDPKNPKELSKKSLKIVSKDEYMQAKTAEMPLEERLKSKLPSVGINLATETPSERKSENSDTTDSGIVAFKEEIQKIFENPEAVLDAPQSFQKTPDMGEIDVVVNGVSQKFLIQIDQEHDGVINVFSLSGKRISPKELPGSVQQDILKAIAEKYKEINISDYIIDEDCGGTSTGGVAPFATKIGQKRLDETEELKSITTELDSGKEYNVYYDIIAVPSDVQDAAGNTAYIEVEKVEDTQSGQEIDTDQLPEQEKQEILAAIAAQEGMNIETTGLAEEKMKGEDPCWDGYEMIGLKPNGDPNRVPVTEEIELNEADKKKWKTRVGTKKDGSPRYVKHGHKDYKIAPGTSRGDSYCARSAGIKKNGKKMDCSGKDKNTPNCLSRKKWRCRGKKSMK